MKLKKITLIESAKKNNISQLRKLLKSGANPNKKDENGLTALYYASKHYQINDDVELSKILLKYGANPNTKVHNDDPLLYHVSQFFKYYNGFELIKVLLKYGANPNVKNREGYTPLHTASKQNNITLVKMLLKAGADPNVKNKKGKTPFDMTNNKEIKTLLLLQMVIKRHVSKQGSRKMFFEVMKKKGIPTKLIIEYLPMVGFGKKKIKHLVSQKPSKALKSKAKKKET